MKKLVPIGAAVALCVSTASVGARVTSVASVTDNQFEATVASPAEVEQALLLKIGATDDLGRVIPGQWQEARAESGVAFSIPGADALFPGSAPVEVTVPVLNDSVDVASALTLSMRQLPDQPESDLVTDPRYLDAMRFSVVQPGTSLVSTAIGGRQDLTSDELQNLQVNALGAQEESSLTLSVRLVSAAEDELFTWADDDLSGSRAFVQLVVDATSVAETSDSHATPSRTKEFS